MNKLIYKLLDMTLYFYPEGLFSKFKYLYKYIGGIIIKRKLRKHGEFVLAFPPVDLKGGEYISVGEHFSAASGLILQCWDKYGTNVYSPEIVIGNNAEFGRNNYIGCINKITIGDNVLTGSNVHITDHNHGTVTVKDIGVPPIKRELFSKGAIIIGDNVWLGDNVIVLPGVEIGDNVIIGANSVVSKSIPCNCVAVGVPTKIIRKLVVD